MTTYHIAGIPVTISDMYNRQTVITVEGNKPGYHGENLAFIEALVIGQLTKLYGYEPAYGSSVKRTGTTLTLTDVTPEMTRYGKFIDSYNFIDAVKELADNPLITPLMAEVNAAMGMPAYREGSAAERGKDRAETLHRLLAAKEAELALEEQRHESHADGVRTGSRQTAREVLNGASTGLAVGLLAGGFALNKLRDEPDKHLPHDTMVSAVTGVALGSAIPAGLALVGTRRREDEPTRPASSTTPPHRAR